jgi:hypothetical protein
VRHPPSYLRYYGVARAVFRATPLLLVQAREKRCRARPANSGLDLSPHSKSISTSAPPWRGVALAKPAAPLREKVTLSFIPEATGGGLVSTSLCATAFQTKPQQFNFMKRESVTTAGRVDLGRHTCITGTGVGREVSRVTEPERMPIL